MSAATKLLLVCPACSFRVRGLAAADVPELGIVCRCGARLLPGELRTDHGRFRTPNLPACEFRGATLGRVDCRCQGKVSVLACAHPHNEHDGRAVSAKKAAMRELPEYLLPSCRECPFKSPGSAAAEPAGVPRWVSEAELARDIATLAAQIPPEVTRIVGIARSGLIPASHLAARLHLPLYSLDNSRRTIVACGHGWRIQDAPPREGGVWLIVDDTQMSGRSLRQAHALLQELTPRPEVLYAVVYRNPALVPYPKPDFWSADLPNPHYLEWNLFNSVFSAKIAVDFDGILCEDCPAGDDDDGPRYEHFLGNVRPKYLMRKSPIPLIASGRLAKWRAPTEAWLAKWGIKFERSRLRLFERSLAERRQPRAISTHKADCYLDWHKVLGLQLFVESDPQQAREIAEFSGLPVLCPAAGKVWVPGKNL